MVGTATGAQVLRLVFAITLLGVTGSGAWAKAGTPVASQDVVLDPEAALASSQAAIGRLVSDFEFLDADSKPISLGDFRGRPLVINLVYTGCAHTCPLIVQSLYHAIDVGQEALGADGFETVTIGFDTNADTPSRMKEFARSQGVDLPGWHFLSGDRQTIDSLTAQLGFAFMPLSGGFDHLAQTTILDENGRVYRHVYGSDFGAPHVVEPLKELIFGRRADLVSFTGLVNQIKLFCTIYSPGSERYRFDYSVFVGALIGFLCLAGIAIVLVRSWLRDWRARSQA